MEDCRHGSLCSDGGFKKIFPMATWRERCVGKSLLVQWPGERLLKQPRGAWERRDTGLEDKEEAHLGAITNGCEK